jgi:hypothetical protein
MNIGNVTDSDPPGCDLSDQLRTIPEAEIKGIVLRCPRAVHVIYRSAAYMLPVKVEERSRQFGQAILGENVGFVVRDADKPRIVCSSDSRVGKFRIQHTKATRNHQARQDPSGKHAFNIVDLITDNLEQAGSRIEEGKRPIDASARADAQRSVGPQRWRACPE